MRGESRDAIRIIDANPPKRVDIVDSADYARADITNGSSVDTAFGKTWPQSVAHSPLTVFHCAAYVDVRDRHPSMTAKYLKVNVLGTQNVLQSARRNRATCFIATSSASIGLQIPSYFTFPWKRWPKNIFQLVPNAEVPSYDASPDECPNCYIWSKRKGEKMVLDANDPSFLTGTIRPGHAIYGHGIESPSSLTYDYLKRGGAPTWIANVTSNFANAQNVSIGHLAYENALLSKGHVGGKGYCVTDPNPPVTYGHLYKMLESLAHPSTPVRFPRVPHILMLLASYLVEQYELLRHSRLQWLPRPHEDLTFLQPAMFNLCTVHTAFTDVQAQDEIGYTAPVTTIEGLAQALLDWNTRIEQSVRNKTTRERFQQCDNESL